MIYLIKPIVYNDKGKHELGEEEEIIAASYSHDEHNNLCFYDEHLNLVIEYHCYNWFSLRPKQEQMELKETTRRDR